MTKPKVFSSSFFLFAVMVLSALSNYVYQILMARSLSVADYGLLNSLIALIGILGFANKAIQTVITKLVIERQKDTLGPLFLFFAKFAFLTLLGFCLCSPVFKSFLHVEGWTPILLVGLTLFLTTVLSTTWGIQQALHLFTDFGTNQLVLHGSKLLISAVFVALSFQINGAVLAIVLSTLLATVTGTLPLRASLKDSHSGKNPFPEELRSLGMRVGGTACLLFLLANLDVLFARHFLDAEISGLYVSFAVLGKMLLILPDCVLTVFFPLASRAHKEGVSAAGLLAKVMALTGALFIPILAVFWWGGDFLLSIFGKQYIQSGPYLFPYAIAMLCMALGRIPVNFWMSKNRFHSFWPMVGALILQIGALVTFHSNIQALVTSMVVSSFAFAAYSIGEIAFVGVKRYPIWNRVKESYS